MCNIAGYIGTKDAAPILIDMMLREECFNGGFYTGLATISEGRLHYAKREGNTDYLLATTNAASLPGTVGIMHSRTNDGGGDAWAHPFIGYHGEEAALAYIANGSPCYFKDRTAAYSVMVEELLAQGYRMARLPHYRNKPYQTLSDGTHVHMSDAMCQLILRNMDQGAEAVDAIAEAFCTFTSEIVGLALDPQYPDRIIWSRINMPVYIAFADHGAYLSSTPMAFPDDIVSEPQLLAPFSSGYVYRDTFTAKRFPRQVATIAPMDMDVRQKAYEAVCARLKEGPERYYPLTVLVEPLFGEGNINHSNPLVYEILLSLHKQGRLHIEKQPMPAAREDLEGYQYFMRLK